MLCREHNLSCGSDGTPDLGEEVEALGANTVPFNPQALGLSLLCIHSTRKGGVDVCLGQAHGERAAT
jgi:hypothetical protein